MLRNLHLHYIGWRREILERELVSLRAQAAALPVGMNQDRTYNLIAIQVNAINPLRRALGLSYISAYA